MALRVEASSLPDKDSIEFPPQPETSVVLRNLVKYDQSICIEYLNKATKEQLWDAFLEGQAKLFFNAEFEWMAKGSWWAETQRILDIGTGNGDYLYRLYCQFKDKAFKGVEKLTDSVRQAQGKYAASPVLFQEGDAEVFDPRLANSSDLVLFRLTLQHLNRPFVALEHAAQYLSSNGHVLIVDACDSARRSSHPIPVLDEALQEVAKVQQKQGNGNRRITLELLKELTIEDSGLSKLYELVSSNLDAEGQVLEQNIRFEGEDNRLRYFNHNLLFITLLRVKFGVFVDLERAYKELKEYLDDATSWSSPGMHYLVLKKKA